MQNNNEVKTSSVKKLGRRILIAAAEACRIPTVQVPEKQIEAQAATALGVTAADLAGRLAALGKAAGRPWTKDQKESAMVAWIALAARERDVDPAARRST